ncbi:tetratricopeptide repeat protein [Serratia marcescens]|uniref:tetratricopeptide repeat protein n=1 Tax=Serratia marcescens TaxID=615 RepID=UPI000E2B1B54|nr:sel1 repeat family protein [Serratia marcescens]
MSARNSLALFYAFGLVGFPKDRAIALSLIKVAAYQGDRDALNNLGELYESGSEEIALDYIKSYVWYATAFSNGMKQAKLFMKRIETNLHSEELIRAQKLATTFRLKYNGPMEEMTHIDPKPNVHIHKSS